MDGENVVYTYVDKKGPHTKPDKLRGGLYSGLTNSETESNHIGWFEVKTL